MINKLEICGLTKRFGEKTLFEDLDLTLAEPAVLWAPSGWGKTTLLRILMGLEVPDSLPGELYTDWIQRLSGEALGAILHYHDSQR